MAWRHTKDEYTQSPWSKQYEGSVVRELDHTDEGFGDRDHYQALCRISTVPARVVDY